LSNEEMVLEQEYISMLYRRLDDLRDRASGRLSGVLRENGGTHQARSERETFGILYGGQIAQIDAAEQGLCFGRLEFDSGERRYIGRIGIHSDGDDYRQLLMDWRADAARPFYLATAASPGGVRVRRHLKTRDRRLISLDDEVLDLALADPNRHEGLTGESALLAALNASRTGRMTDIVETIQAEQDAIIRAPLPGVLVVQGGPGTGKTAVALHRAAYLLYTYRRQLEKRGVLVVGPNATFLRYIGEVLPSLGETSVLLSTIADLFPGVRARGTEPAEVAVLKGRLQLARVIAAAVRDRQRLPAGGVLEISYERDVLRLSRDEVAGARERARRSRLPHNRARQVFARTLITALTRKAAARLGDNVLGGPNLLDSDDLEDLRDELRADPAVRVAIDSLWPLLTPQQLLADLYASDRLLASAAPSLTGPERALLHREPGSGPVSWTPADVPLLDEAAERLGSDDQAARARAERQRRIQEAYSQGVLDIHARDADPETLQAADVLDAAQLALRQEDEAGLTAADRAAVDRTWAFGHVIVDEAQELSPMAWRMLMRRCPARSMTIVGDVAQTGDPASPGSWDEALDEYLSGRWRLAGLTINYRTPAEIMTVAADVLAAIGPGHEPPRSVRESGSEPWRLEAKPEDLGEALAWAAGQMAARTGDGKLAVLVPASRLGELGRAVRDRLPGTEIGEQPDGPDGAAGNDAAGTGTAGSGAVRLDSPVVVLSVRQAKGLEFDSVLIADPAQILAESPRGLNDLYVALTRATQRAGVVYAGPLPPVLDRLRPVEDVPE
jgi:DNA helicase IV